MLTKALWVKDAVSTLRLCLSVCFAFNAVAAARLLWLWSEKQDPGLLLHTSCPTHTSAASQTLPKDKPPHSLCKPAPSITTATLEQGGEAWIFFNFSEESAGGKTTTVGSASGWITYEATTKKQRDRPSILGTLLNGSYLEYLTNVTFT